MVKGSCLAVIDRGYGIEKITLNAPMDMLYVPNFVWHGLQDFSHDAIILALSSTNYRPDRSDYCHDYDLFQKIKFFHQNQDHDHKSDHLNHQHQQYNGHPCISN